MINVFQYCHFPGDNSKTLVGKKPVLYGFKSAQRVSNILKIPTTYRAYLTNRFAFTSQKFSPKQGRGEARGGGFVRERLAVLGETAVQGFR